MDQALEEPLPAAARRGGRTPFPNPVDVFLAIDRAHADTVRSRARRERVTATEAIRRMIGEAAGALSSSGSIELPRSRRGPRRPTRGTGLRITVTLPGPLVDELDQIARHVAARQGEPDLLERTRRNEMVRRVIQWSENQ